MLCPYQLLGGSLPVFCDEHNAKWKKKQKTDCVMYTIQNDKKTKKTESSAKLFYELGKVFLGLDGTSNSKCDPKLVEN